MKKRSSDWWDNIVTSENFDEWVKNFRVDRATFRYLCNKLEPELRPDPFCVREPLAVDKKVAFALYKLASCAEYRVVGNQFGVHKTSAHRCIKQFCTAVIKVLLPEEIKMPTIEEAKILAAKFNEKSGISPIIGAIDGTHVPVIPPEEGYRDFINRKSWPSVILQGLVDANYSFIDITVKHPACTHDTVVLKDSFLYKTINNYPMPSEIINGKEINAFLIGDPAYPLQDWLMKGYASASTLEEESVGVYLNKARIVAENVFGRVESRWRILQKKMDANISLLPKIAATCCVLHNIAQRSKVSIQENWNVELAKTSILYPQHQNSNSSQASSSANEIRNHIKNCMAQNYPLLRRFSDPYCMLGIQPAGPPISPQPPPLTPRAQSQTETTPQFDNNLDSPQHDKLRKHHSFRLSFKRKDGARREHRDSLGGPVPAKFIRATSIKPHTLCPKWNEKFKFDIDDINTDTFHLDIWDHDDESCVLDAVSRLNEVRGVRGLGRFFKQVCQSARQGSQDDFLGSVNIPLADIPSTGLEGWFKLEARSQRSTVQGRIRLKLWLSTREDRGTSEEDNTIEVKKLERLHMAFMKHELNNYEPPKWTWNGELPGPALTTIHQMAVQGDVTDLQSALAKYVAAAKLNRTIPIDPKYIHKLLLEIDKLWGQPNQGHLSRDLEQWLADSMTVFIEKSLNQIRRHRDQFPALHPPSLVRLEFLLRCLGLLGSMKAFRQVCPFNKGVRGEIVGALRKGSVHWAQQALREAQRSPIPMVQFTTVLIADLQLGLTYYHSLFDSTNGIQYFSIIYKQFDGLLAEEVTSRMETSQILVTSLSHWTVMEDDKEPADTQAFELYLTLQEFAALKQHLSVTPQPPEKPLSLQNCHEWFEPAVRRWLSVSKAKALQRIRAAIALDRLCEGERIVRHSTSSVDTASCFYQLREFWRLLAWPEPNSGGQFEAQLIDAACSAAMHYGDLIHQALADKGYYEQSGPFRTSDDMCITVNNLEYVRRSLAEFRPDGQNLNDNAEALLESSLSQMEARAERVLGRLGPLMQAPLQKAVFHLAWSPDSLPTNQAIVPLLEYLDVHLSTLNSALLTKNFNRSLTMIWNTVLNELSHQMNTGADGDRPTVFHDRLYEALLQLGDFFHAEGLGLPMENLHCDAYWRVEQRLQYHKTDTDRLIDLFYIQRLQDQMITNSAGPYGSLAIRTYFNHDSLCVEVLHARDIIPLDPNGFSDPFVIVELLPRRIFSHCAEQQTNVHKKTLNPVFDECFEFSVTLEQCLIEGAMIAFTVMDHDVLTANDFAGEAFLALSNVPGVADYSTSVENFHGLKHVDLPLMQQHDKSHPILQILESRLNDKQAIDFVKKQKARLAV